MHLIRSLTILICFAPLCVRATTWDEPWHETVVKDADTFVKATVVKTGPKAITLKVLKQLAGERVPETLTVDRFSKLRIGSMTIGGGGGADHELQFHFAQDEHWYFFLKKVKEKDHESWALPTPTSGFAGADKGLVYATYRHSYHQSLVPEDLYEPSMTAIFQYLHDQKYDQDFVHKLIKTELAQPPHGLKKGDDEASRKIFFRQHVALESFYHFGTADEYALLEPFLKSSDYHTSISAVRALSRIDTPDARARLWDYLTSEHPGFARVMAVQGLKRLNAREYLAKLREFIKVAPEEETGFGGNIMDPRVGTHFPRSVKAACEELVADWEQAK
jgi:hypothetical protein